MAESTNLFWRTPWVWSKGWLEKMLSRRHVTKANAAALLLAHPSLQASGTMSGFGAKVTKLIPGHGNLGQKGVRMRTGLIAGSMAITFILCGLQAAADVPALYTAAQAEEGEYIFVHKCAECHGAKLEGLSATPLKGPDFRRLAAARNLNVQSLLTFISQYMPRYAPGSLTSLQYSDLIAFILQQNGYPAGSSELSADTPNLKDVSLSP